MSNATIQTLPSPIQADIRTPAIFKTVTEFIAAAAKIIGTRPSHAGDPTRLPAQRPRSQGHRRQPPPHRRRRHGIVLAGIGLVPSPQGVFRVRNLQARILTAPFLLRRAS